MYHYFLEPSEVKNLTVNTVVKVCLKYLSVLWYPPAMPNGIIIMYEIHYKESSSNNMYINVHNTTSTQYTIDQLSGSSAIEIKVRGYTIAGPGRWATIIVSGKKIMFYVLNLSSSIRCTSLELFSNSSQL